MTKEEIIVNLSGQIINGIMSSSDSWIAKLLESSFHSQVADMAVDMAKHMYKKIVEENN